MQHIGYMTKHLHCHLADAFIQIDLQCIHILHFTFTQFVFKCSVSGPCGVCDLWDKVC